MKRVFAIMAGAVLIASCGEAVKSDYRSTPKPHPHYPVVQTINGRQPTNFWHGTVDGRECIAVYNYGYSDGNEGWNGVTCDWTPK